MAKRKDIPPVPVSGSAENIRISTRFESQTAPVITSVKKRPEKSENQMGPSSLRRSERGKNPVDVPASNAKSTEVKTAVISKERFNVGSRDVGGRKRKRFNAIQFKAQFKPQRVRVESDDEEGSEDEDGTSTSEAKSSSNRDGDKLMANRNKVGKRSDEADGQPVKGSHDKAQKAVLEKGLKASDQEEHVGCPSQTKPVEGESVGSGNVEKQIGDNCLPSNGHTADSDNHVSHTSLSRINHVLENQQELDFRDKNHANFNIQNAGSIVNSSKFVEYWVPVQLSNVQLEQYCASLLSNAAIFQSSSKRATDEALLEILNSNRKCCNHPYLVDAKLEQKLLEDLKPTRRLDVDIKVSGKLQFLDLILPEVRKRQLRVLILYQPTSGTASVGPVLAEFVHQRFGEDSYECLDAVGIVVPSKKQTALSNFNNDENRFIFLLVSNACNSSIKLSSIDLVIIFDSDLNPSTDIKSLQKISLYSQSEQMMVVRLYTSSTLEEKVLKLADHDNIIQNLRSKNDALLMWGAPDLFNRLKEFHSQSDINISSEESFLNDVVKEFLHIIFRKSESSDTAKSFITRVESCGSYGKNNMFHNETKTLLPDGDQPHVFWKKLLEGQNPVWKFRSESTPRQRKRPNFFSDSCDVNTRRKTVKNVVEGETGRSNEGVPVQNVSQLSSGDHFWSTTVGNETSAGNEKILHDLLKPKVSELCIKLKFSENVTTLVESFLKFVIENFQVFTEQTSTLQALMISVCWIGSSMSKYMMDMIDREESFALAKKDLNFICSKEHADQVYEKLQSAKETFLQNTEDREIVNNIEECTMSHQEPRMSTESQASKPENHDSSNERTLQSDEQIVKEDFAGKDEDEIDRFNRAWDEKRMDLEKERQINEALVRVLHPSKSSIRSEKLNSVQKDFTIKLNEHERLRMIELSDLKAKLKAAVGQVVVNDERSLHGPALEIQIVDSVRSEKGDQGSPEAAPVSSENPSEAQIRDKSLYKLSPVVVPAEVIDISDDDSDRESIGSHSSEEQTAEAMVKSEAIGDDPAIEHVNIEKDVRVDNETLLSEPTGDMSAIPSSIPIEKNASELHDEVENDVVGADTMVINEPIGEIPAKLDADMENDEAGRAKCVEMEVLEVDTNKENVDSAEMEMLAVDNISQNVESADGSQEVQTKSNPMVQTEDSILQPVDMGQVDQIVVAETPITDQVIAENHSAIVPVSDLLAQTTSEPMVAAETPIATQIQNAILLEQDDVVPHEESAELRISAVECNEDNADDDSIMSAGTSHCAENLKDSSDSHGVEHVVSDDSVPVLPDIQNGSLQVEEFLDSGIQDKEVQVEPTLMVEIEDNILQSIDIEHVDPVVPDDPSSNSHNEPLVAVETPVTDPMVTENQSVTPPLVTDPVVPDDPSPNSHNEPFVAVETPVSDSMAPDDPSHNSQNEPLMAVETPVTLPMVTDPVVPDYPSPNSHNEPLVAVETPVTDPMVIENQSVTLRLVTDPVVPDDPSPSSHTEPLVAVEKLVTDPMVTDLVVPDDPSPNFHDEPRVSVETPVTDPMVTENQSVTIPLVTDSVVPNDPSPDSHNEPLVAVETPVTDPVVTENQSVILPMVADPVVPDDPSPNSRNEPLVAVETLVADPMVTYQPATFPTSEVLAQTTSASIVASETPITAQRERIYNLQLNGNINQVGSRRMHSTSSDPLNWELQRLHSGKETMVKMHQENMQKISVDCEREIAEVTVQIRLKYGNKRQEAETAFNSQCQEVETNMQKVVWNKVLAAAFRSKCKDLSPENAGQQQASPAGLMQQLRRIPGPSSVSCSPGQSSGTQQSTIPPPSVSAAAAPLPISAAAPSPPISATVAPPALPATSLLPQTLQRTQPPLQIVDNASALFSTPLTRHTHNTTSTPIRPTTTTPIRPQLNPNPIPNTPSTTTTSIAAPIVTPVTTSTTSSPIRLPHGSNHLSPSTTPIRPPIRLGSFDMSAANLRINTETRRQSPHSRPLGNSVSRGAAPHMRPMVSREVRSPGPHLRPLARTDFRSPAPHMRSFASTGARFTAPHMRPFRPTSEPSTFQPQLPGQHATSNISSASTSQPQPLAPPPSESFPVPPPAPVRSESPQPPPPPPQLSRTSHQHRRRSMDDNLNVLRDNVTRRMNAAQQTSELVCLSDDD